MYLQQPPTRQVAEVDAKSTPHHLDWSVGWDGISALIRHRLFYVMAELFKIVNQMILGVLKFSNQTRL